MAMEDLPAAKGTLAAVKTAAVGEPSYQLDCPGRNPSWSQLGPAFRVNIARIE